MASGKSDASVHPSWNDYAELFAELDLSKNENISYYGKPISPLELIVTTNKLLDWKCSICCNEWVASGYSRSKDGQGCPYCNNGRLHSDGRNSMANTHPKLAREYQGDATKIIAGNRKILDWICSVCNHEWKTSPKARKKAKGCPYCSNGRLHSDGRNSMANTHPKLAKEYQGDATKIVAGTHNILDWICSVCDHEWNTKGYQRGVQGDGCPSCFGSLHSDGRNSMANTHPKLAKEYQGDATLIIAGTSDILDWKCSECEHEWRTTGSSRTSGKGCGVCNNGILHSDCRNSMANTHPKLAKEYQGDAATIIAGTHNILHWKCSICEHEWKVPGHNRVQGDGCGVCNNGILHSDRRNSMANTHPELAKEYQGDAATIIAGTHHILHWKCSICEHEWKVPGHNRVQGNGCTVCSIFGYDPTSVGYLYIHHYSLDGENWLKCGITNSPEKRYHKLRNSAKKYNIEVNQLEIYRFDDGFNATNCEKELLDLNNIRYTSNYKIDGHTEFFKFESLDKIIKIIQEWL